MQEERKWWKEGVVYQVYPRSFQDSNGDGIGDLNGITSRLDYIASLGADIIWLNPVYSSPNDDNGYDISDYRNIMTEFGTLDDFRTLLSAAHSKGIRIIMDLVVNHSSDEHPWFIESRKSTDNPYRDYYIWRKEKNNWGACFGGSAWEYDKATDMYYLHCFSKKQPDLNWENETVRKEVYDLMSFWGDIGIDGFRMDVITMISKDQRFPDGKLLPTGYGNSAPYTGNGPRVHEFLQEMNRNVISRYDWLTVGEGAGAGIDDALLYTGYERKELDMVFSFEHMNIGKKESGNGYSPAPFTLPEYKKVLSKWQYGLEGKGWNSLYLENHDQTRSVSRYGNTSTPELWKKSAKMLAAVYMLMKGTPYIYEGQELGMINYPFSDISENRDISAKNDYRELISKGRSSREAMEIICEISRDNSRTPMQWDDSQYAGFSTHTPWIGVNPSKSYINAAAEENDPDSILNFYRKLIALRKSEDALLYGVYHPEAEDDEDLFIYTRTDEHARFTICANWHGGEREFILPEGEIVLSNYPDSTSGRLRAYEAYVIKETL